MRKTMFLVSFAALAGAIGLAAAQEGGPGGRGQEHLAQVDTNHDGAISRAEFDAAHAAMFARLDANHDGQISAEEHRAHRGEHMGEHRGRRRGGDGEHRGDHEGGRMAMLDANQDGSITRDEFLARPMQMFDRLDANHDGAISADERSAARERMHERREHRSGEQ